MRNNRRLLVAILCIALLTTQSSLIFAGETEGNDYASKSDESTSDLLAGKDYAEGELIVVFDDSVSDKAISKIADNIDASCENISAIDDRQKMANITLDKKDDMENALEKLQDNSKTLYVQPNYRYKKTLGNDPYMNNNDRINYQYHFDNVKALAAWDKLETVSHGKTLVAVIDTGVDITHEDLKANLKTKDYYIRLHDGDVEQLKEDVDSEYSHGTHVTGIIGATYDNGKGGAGIASGYKNDLVEVMVVGNMSDDSYIYTNDIIDSINYAVDQKAKVINMSFGGYGRDYALKDAIKSAYDKGTVFVASSGNDGTDEIGDISALKEVISVNATTATNEPLSWSDYGIEKDISAPGDMIQSTLQGDSYGKLSGTSMSSPIVAAVAALVLDANPDLTPRQVYNILCASTGQNEFKSESTGYGVVDAEAAVIAAIETKTNKNVKADKLTIKTQEIFLNEGDFFQLETLIRPATCLTNVSWESLNPDYASVDDNGEVTALKEGKATIRGSADGKSVECIVNIEKGEKLTQLTISNKADFDTIGEDEYISLKVSTNINNYNLYNLIFESSDENIVALRGNEVIAKSKGSATITVRNHENTLRDSFTVNVKAKATGIEMSSKTSQLQIGENLLFKSKILRRDKTSEEVAERTTWKSTDESIATVDSKGEVTACGEGVTYIVATYENRSDFKLNVKTKLTVSKTDYKDTDYGLKKYKSTYNSAALKWNSILTANGYVIERAPSINGAYKAVKIITSGSTTSYTDKNLTTGNTYYYRVKARYAKNGQTKYFSYSSKASVKPLVEKTKVSLTSKSKGTMNIKWSRVSGASGYTIYKSTSKNGKYRAVKVIKKASTVTYKNIKLKSGKKYFYKVKAFRVVKGKRVYGATSNIAYRTVK